MDEKVKGTLLENIHYSQYVDKLAQNYILRGLRWHFFFTPQSGKNQIKQALPATRQGSAFQSAFSKYIYM